MTIPRPDTARLALTGLIVLGLVLTVLAVVSSSIVVAWSAGAITVGGALGLWR